MLGSRTTCWGVDEVETQENVLRRVEDGEVWRWHEAVSNDYINSINR